MTHISFKLALISKGLRHLSLAIYSKGLQFQACPDFKGIKTGTFGRCPRRCRFQACPDFKGIKTTCRRVARQCHQGFKLALISKGLRPVYCQGLDALGSFKLALISKGLRRLSFGHLFQMPGFKLALISKGLRRNHRHDIPQRVVSSLP